MHIHPCTSADLDDWAALRHALWADEGSEAELRTEAAEMLATDTGLNLIARDEAGAAIGFAEATLRRDYVSGCETSPVVFLEGIYVVPAHRHRGVAAALVERVAGWGRDQGCTEFASDSLLDNHASHAFHAAVGFEEVERTVWFRKRL